MPRGPKARNQTELGTELPLKVKLGEALPNTWLYRKELMEDGKVALLACSLISQVFCEVCGPSKERKPSQEVFSAEITEPPEPEKLFSWLCKPAKWRKTWMHRHLKHQLSTHYVMFFFFIFFIPAHFLIFIISFNK